MKYQDQTKQQLKQILMNSPTLEVIQEIRAELERRVKIEAERLGMTKDEAVSLASKNIRGI